MHQAKNYPIRWSSNHRQWRWITPALAVFSAVTAVGMLVLALHARSGGELAFWGVLLAPVVLILAFAVIRQGASHVGVFFSSSLRWWHVLWMLAFVSALVFRIRTVNDIATDPLDAWAVYRVVVDMLVAFGLLGILAVRRIHWLGSMFRGVVGALTIFGLVEVASTVWSVYPSWTLYKSLEYLVDVALLAAILESVSSIKDYRKFFNWTWALYGMLLLSVWMGAVIWPRAALHGQFIGRGAELGLRLEGVLPALSSNDVGTFAGIIVLVCLARLIPASNERFRKLWYLFLLGAGLVTMVLAQTRTAFAGLLFGIFIVLIYSKRGRLGAMITLVVAPIVALSTMGGLIWSFFERGQTEAQLATLSSRAQWWEFAWQTYLERPLTGFGAYAAGRFAVLAKLGMVGTSTLHSDYLDIIAGTGFWGLIPFLVVLVATWWYLLRYMRDPSLDDEGRQLAYEALAILALLTFRSIFMTMLIWHPPLHFLAIIGYVEFLRRRQRVAVRYAPQAVHFVPAIERHQQLDLIFAAPGRRTPQNPDSSN